MFKLMLLCGLRMMVNAQLALGSNKAPALRMRMCEQLKNDRCVAGALVCGPQA